MVVWRPGVNNSFIYSSGYWRKLLAFLRLLIISISLLLNGFSIEDHFATPALTGALGFSEDTSRPQSFLICKIEAASKPLESITVATSGVPVPDDP